MFRRARYGKTTNSTVNAFSETPIAQATSAQGGIRITAPNVQARKEGVIHDMLLAHAKALCPPLQVYDDDPIGDQEDLKRLAEWCIRYSPWVNTEPPDGIMIDITGCAHLFGGEEALCNDIQRRLDKFGFRVKIAIADTIGCAVAVSRFGKRDTHIIPEGVIKSALADLPIAALRVGQDITDRLAKVGLKKIGSLIDKPRAPLAARYGIFLVDRLDQALGRKAESLSPIAEPPDYRTHQTFGEPILQLDQIELSLEALAKALSQTLETASLGARLFKLSLYRVDGDIKTLSISTSSLTNKSGHIIRLMKEKVADLGSQYDTGFGIEKIILGAYFTEHVTHHQINLDRKKESGSLDDFKALIDRYGNRLGFNNVGQFLPMESHIPERCEKLISISDKNNKPHNWNSFLNDLQGGVHLGRPIVLLPRPEPITAIAEVPDGPPVNFEWRRLVFRIAKAEGPERLSPEWWLHSELGREPTRDYFRVEDIEGGRFWLFRQGLYERGEHPIWFMHGFFA